MTFGPTDQADPAHGKPWWMERFDEINARKPAGQVDLLFIGDSITQAWETVPETWNKFYGRRNAINLGFAGDLTQNILWRLTHGHLDGIQPRTAVIMAGTNNCTWDVYSAHDVAAGIKAICNLLIERVPGIKILLLGVFPRDPSPSPMRAKVAEVNRLASAFADWDQIHFLDIGPIFLEPDLSISPDTMPDFLHLVPQMYHRWAEAIEPKLRQLMGEEPL